MNTIFQNSPLFMKGIHITPFVTCHDNYWRDGYNPNDILWYCWASIHVTSVNLKAVKESPEANHGTVHLLGRRCICRWEYCDHFCYSTYVEIAEFHILILSAESQTVCQWFTCIMNNFQNILQQKLLITDICAISHIW